jgi:PIF1-like helicase
MANRAAIEAVDRLLQKLSFKSISFGGIPFIGVGDFRQTAPIVKGSNAEMVLFENSIKSSALWRRFEVIELCTSVRMADDMEFDIWVEKIGSGTIQNHTQEVTDTHSYITVSEFLLFYFTEQEAFEFLYGDDSINDFTKDVSLRSFLSPLNAVVDRFNTLVIERVRTPSGTYVL